MKLRYLMFVFCAFSLTACGNKGKLKTPSQIAVEQQKKTKRLEKKQRDEAKAKARQGDDTDDTDSGAPLTNTVEEGPNPALPQP